MILIADSGSTKTDWAVIEDDKLIKTIKTAGLNPFQLSEEQIIQELKAHLLPQLPPETYPASSQLGKGNLAVKAAKGVSLHFYGAGCTPEKQPIVERALRKVLNIDKCEIASDMLGAARAVCGDKPGICCILGTGSNSCLYDGDKIVKNVSPLGFILGDEGSGAVMGKILLGDILKNQMPQHIIDRFFEKYDLTQADIIDRVYRQPKPNTFLASFMPFVQENIEEPKIYTLVKESFRSFLNRNVKQYEGWKTLPIGFVGSIAKIYNNILEEVINEEGMHLGKIIKAPLEALC